MICFLRESEKGIGPYTNNRDLKKELFLML